MEILMKREIGSHFHWDSGFFRKIYDSIKDSKTQTYNLKLTNSPNELLVSSGRQAIIVALYDIEIINSSRNINSKKIALLPSYTCYSVIDPFLRMGYQVYFYSVNEDMSVKASEINALIKEFCPSVMLFHPYFGFQTIEFDENIAQDNLFIIHDNTHSWLSKISYPFVDYTVCSLRKWGALPDGAYVTKENGNFCYDVLDQTDVELVEKTIEAYQKKELYLKGKLANKEDFLSIFVDASELLKSRNNVYKMEERSKIALRFQYQEIEETKRIRRSNFNVLKSYHKWEEFGQLLFDQIDVDTVPLYFPFRVNVMKREKLQKYLATRSIYCPVIWPKPKNINVKLLTKNAIATTMLQNELLCIPIDQRYSNSDMEEILTQLNNYLSLFGHKQ